MLRTYYMLNIDNYGQPDGTITEVNVSEQEADDLRARGAWLYDNYEEAMYRAMD